ncbi:MAG: sn-glycerol-3-phosphate ABC transporter ATP-binding protein UgpC [Pseudomonadota bacterium]
MSKLTLHNLQKSYGDVDVIHGIDMSIESGEFCVFVGPSGCGKSTMLRMIAGLEDVTDGEVRIDDEVVNAIPAAQRGLAMVFQSYALYPHMSVRANLSFGLENLNMPKAEIKTRVDAAAKMLQIEPLMSRRPGQLSGGQRQRVAIGRAVVREPKIFLFDEPLSNLDAELRVTMRGEIADLHKRLGNTMIYVTHDQVEAMTMADKIAVLRGGILEQFGRPLDLYNKPDNLFVAGFIGSPRMNFLKGTVGAGAKGKIKVDLDCGQSVTLPATKFATTKGQAVTLGIRANHITASKTSKLKLNTRAVEQLGGETYVYGAVDGGEEMTLHLPGQAAVQAGDKLGISFVEDEVHLFDTDAGKSLAK